MYIYMTLKFSRSDSFNVLHGETRSIYPSFAFIVSGNITSPGRIRGTDKDSGNELGALI